MVSHWPKGYNKEKSMFWKEGNMPERQAQIPMMHWNRTSSRLCRVKGGANISIILVFFSLQRKPHMEQSVSVFLIFGLSQKKLISTILFRDKTIVAVVNMPLSQDATLSPRFCAAEMELRLDEPSVSV